MGAITSRHESSLQQRWPLRLMAVVAGGAGAAEQTKRDDRQAEAPAPKTPAEIRAEIYARLAVSADADETEGLVGLLLAAYSQSGSDTGDLLLERAHKAITPQDAGAAEQNSRRRHRLHAR